MRGVFVDANEALAAIMERLEKPGDPKVRIHRNPDIKPEQYPEVLDGAEIAIVDHTALPTEVMVRVWPLSLAGPRLSLPSSVEARMVRAPLSSTTLLSVSALAVGASFTSVIVKLAVAVLVSGSARPFVVPLSVTV